MKNNKLRFSLIALFLIFCVFFTPIQVSARDIPLKKVEELTATIIPELLSVNNISTESNEYELRNYIPEYIYSPNGLIERPVVYFPVYSNGTVVAKIAGIYDSKNNGYAYCSSIGSVEILNMSTQYFSKGIYVDIKDDCFYTDGKTFISMTSGTISTINDFDEDCQNILNNFFLTFDWTSLSLYKTECNNSVCRVQSFDSNKVLIKLLSYRKGNSLISEGYLYK